MGTRADFYIGRGKSAEWIGSIAWDGYPDGRDIQRLITGSQLTRSLGSDFRATVNTVMGKRDDFTRPEEGWPWPWGTSHTTDYAYAWDKGEIWCSCFGHEWQRLEDWDGDAEDEKMPKDAFPDMSDIKSVTLGKKSGVIVMG